MIIFRKIDAGCEGAAIASGARSDVSKLLPTANCSTQWRHHLLTRPSRLSNKTRRHASRARRFTDGFKQEVPFASSSRGKPPARDDGWLHASGHVTVVDGTHTTMFCSSLKDGWRSVLAQYTSVRICLSQNWSITHKHRRWQCPDCCFPGVRVDDLLRLTFHQPLFKRARAGADFGRRSADFWICIRLVRCVLHVRRVVEPLGPSWPVARRNERKNTLDRNLFTPTGMRTRYPPTSVVSVCGWRAMTPAPYSRLKISYGPLLVPLSAVT